MGEIANYNNRSQNDATEQGYTAKMRRNILGTEKNIRTNKDESMHVFDSEGNKVLTFQGKGAGVAVTKEQYDSVPENAIITHNHPRALTEKVYNENRKLVLSARH